MQFLDEVVSETWVPGTVQTVQKRLEVSEVQFWRGCGRPCALAATSGRSLRFSHRQGQDDLRMDIFPYFAAFFALRSRGREC